MTKILTVNVYQGAAAASLNPVVSRNKQDATAELANNKSAFLLRKYHATIDGNEFSGWRVWTCTNRSGSTQTLSVSASEDEPAYYVSYNDTALDFSTCLGLLDPDDFIQLVIGGNGGTGTARYENWTFFPDTEWDFSPFTNDVDARLDA